jgi:homoserine O-acetyltransferase/O-succinyltransferase
MNTLKSTIPFILESGAVLPQLDIAYHTYGTLNAEGSNVVWICHALTAGSDAADWWNGLVGEGKLFDPARHFIVCANMLGSCYGATNANSINPTTGKRYGESFPLITIRDMVHSHQILQKHLKINKIQVCIGGSMGGQQAVEWAIIEPTLIEQIVVIAAGAKLNAWSRGWNSAQRLALEADATLFEHSPFAGKKGLAAARAMGMMCYRTYEAYNELQADEEDTLEAYKMDSYLRYQGLKLNKRFTALAYLSITKSMDSHDVGRNRGGVANALQQILAKALIISIHSDILFPLEEQVELARYIPNAQLEIIDSPYGHDGFLLENEQITQLIKQFQARFQEKEPVKYLHLAAA